MYMLAAQGMSRAGVAATIGLTSSTRIPEWIALGKARGEEPFAEFARRYPEAERLAEVQLTGIQTSQQRFIAAKHPSMRTPQEMAWVDRQLARKFPREHGAGEGLMSLRVLDQEIDLDAWWVAQGLEQEQCQALLREPPETLGAALLAEADAVFAYLHSKGWQPPRRVKP
jgi:hypothetical protein